MDDQARNQASGEATSSNETSELTPSARLDQADLGQAYEALLQHQAWDVEAPAPPANPEILPPTEAPPPPHRIVEALLFVGGEPLTAARAGEIIRGLTADQFAQIIATLNRDYRRQGRPYTLVSQDQGYVLALRPRFRGVVDKLYGGVREARLSPAAIDVLALLAYRQPATKAEIDSLRGLESGPLLRQLVRRGLATILERGQAGQREVTYGTTPRFLEMFGLSSLDDLPRTQDLQRI